jgi:hypothetical protein
MTEKTTPAAPAAAEPAPVPQPDVEEKAKKKVLTGTTSLADYAKRVAERAPKKPAAAKSKRG